MPSHRSLRMAEAIREVVSHAILFEVSDPRVKGVTVLHAEVSGDLRNATAFVSIMGTPAEQENAMRGLRSATGYLQSLVAARLQTRSTPVLAFKRDEGIKKSVEMSRLIEETLAADRTAHGGDRDEPEGEAIEDEAEDEDDEDEDEADAPKP
jgi:ribosome-binding factor A